MSIQKVPKKRILGSKNDPLFGKGGKEAEFQNFVLGDSYFFGLIRKSCFMNFFRCLSKNSLKIGFLKKPKQAGTELCQAQLKLASSLYCFRLKDNSGS